MRRIHLFEDPILTRLIRQQWKVSRICFAVIVQGVLLLAIRQLLFHAKLGRFPDLIFLSEALLILIIAPYLACSKLNKHFGLPPSTDLLRLSPMPPHGTWGSVILGSQIYTICFVGFTTFVFVILLPAVSEVSHRQVVLLHVVFGVYIFVGAAVGGFWWYVFRNELFATELTYFMWSVFIGGVFLLSPLDRYLENLQPIIPPFLHLNPLIAVCHLLEIDVFRTPHLYELTPITSYLFVYPPWYIICGWQILIGICCFARVLRSGNP